MTCDDMLLFVLLRLALRVTEVFANEDRLSVVYVRVLSDNGVKLLVVVVAVVCLLRD